jgi:hypothetical protein
MDSFIGFSWMVNVWSLSIPEESERAVYVAPVMLDASSEMGNNMIAACSAALVPGFFWSQNYTQFWLL